MSNELHRNATRFAAIALVPAFLAIGAGLAWELQPMSVASTGAVQAPAWTLVAPEPPAIDVIVGSVSQVSKPAAKATAVATVAAPKVQYCETYAMYNSSTEKVRICHWM